MTIESPYDYIAYVLIILFMVVMYIYGKRGEKLINYTIDHFPEILSGIKPNQILKMNRIKEILIKNDAYKKFNDVELTRIVYLYKKSEFIFNVFFIPLSFLLVYGFIKELTGPKWQKSLVYFSISLLAPISGILILLLLKKMSKR